MKRLLILGTLIFSAFSWGETLQTFHSLSVSVTPPGQMMAPPQVSWEVGNVSWPQAMPGQAINFSFPITVTAFIQGSACNGTLAYQQTSHPIQVQPVNQPPLAVEAISYDVIQLQSGFPCLVSSQPQAPLQIQLPVTFDVTNYVPFPATNNTSAGPFPAPAPATTFTRYLAIGGAVYGLQLSLTGENYQINPIQLQ